MLSRARFVMGLASVLAIAALVLMSGSQAQQPTGSKSGGTSPGLITSVPRTMTYQGILNDTDGDPVRNTTLNVTFRIFDADTGGNELWSEVVQVTTDQSGNFTATLSDLNLPFDEDYYLELQIEGDPQPLEPRQKLHMTPYSARTDTSECAVDVIDNAITSTKIADGTIQFDDIGQNSAADGQVIKWSGSAWTAAEDEVVSGSHVYDSGWFPALVNSNYILPHNLGMTRLIITLYYSASENGSNPIVQGIGNQRVNTDNNKLLLSPNIYNITHSHLTVGTGNECLAIGFHDPSGGGEVSSGYLRVVALALE